MTEECIRPISPAEVEKERITTFPSIVFQAFNELIMENYSDGCSTVVQDDVVKRMVELGLVCDEIYKKGWLDVEGMYRKNGWKVDYDQPGYNEDYDAYFVFTKKRGGRSSREE